MSSRYTYRKIKRNRDEIYKEQLEDRNKKFIRHFNTPNMSYPNSSQRKVMTIREHIWKAGDRYYKLAHEHYGEKELWWLIAWYNRAPTESHLRIGRVVRIPTPLSAALSYMRDKKWHY